MVISTGVYVNQDSTKLEMGKIILNIRCAVFQTPKSVEMFERQTGLNIEFHPGKSRFGGTYQNKSDKYTNNLSKLTPAGSLVMSVRAQVGDANILKRTITIGL